MIVLRSKGPFNLPLSLKVMTNFSPDPFSETRVLREAVSVNGKPLVFEAEQIKKTPPLIKISNYSGNAKEIKEIAEWMLFTELDLLPFYKIAKGNKVLSSIIKELYGLKYVRPASLFEMMVIAITEQQISLSAAYRIRNRLVRRFGDEVEGLFVFPSANSLAKASEKELRSCGLSKRKSEYIIGVARQVSDGSLNISKLKSLSDEDFREALTKIRGFGPWSANYILVRGLGRVDSVPADDLAVRSVAGKYLGKGERMSKTRVLKAVKPFSPFRGLAVFYLLAYDRLCKKSLKAEVGWAQTK
jgi:DNA-3-methyladenine glycosylase II